MATIRSFTELRCWQEARLIAKDVYSLTRVGLFVKDHGLKDQVQRAAVSIGSNIAEGFERNGNKEFEKFLWIAKGSTGEEEGVVTEGEIIVDSEGNNANNKTEEEKKE